MHLQKNKSKAQTIQAIRGMNDILPDASSYWSYLEEIFRSLAIRYGYKEIRPPIVEKTQLFERSIGSITDIVEKEMYTFEDRNGDSLTLRPEGTAGCVRAGIEHGLLYHQVQRLWYLGPMFRHERPQKGRYRQFYQLGIEAYGMSGPEIDAELILLGERLWQALNIRPLLKLQLNTLGTFASRAKYHDILVDYFKQHYDELDADSQRRIASNPLRILDSKNPAMQSLIAAAPKIVDYLDDASQRQFDGLRAILDSAKVPYELNPHLVRGLDYYTFSVFEWVTDTLGAQGTVCAGGRYDALVEQLGGKPTPAVGLAAGLERLILLLTKTSKANIVQQPDIYMVLVGEAAEKAGLLIAERLRDEFSQINIELNLSGGSFKSQFKRADKSGAHWALIIGEEEAANNQMSLKNLREEMPQQQFTIETLIGYLQDKELS